MANLVEATDLSSRNPKPLAFISYATPDYGFAQTVKHRLENTGCLTVFLAPESISAGQNWSREVIRSLNKCSFFVPIISRDSESAHFHQAEIVRALSSIKGSGDNRRVIPLVLDRTPLPLGLELFQYIDVNEPASDTWSTQLNNSILSSPALQGAPYNLEFWEHKLKESNLGPLTDTLSIYLAGMAKHRDLIEPALKLIDRVNECLSINPEISYRAHLVHINRILGHMRKLCLSSSEGGLEKDPADFVIQEPTEYFVAGFAAVLHNICLLEHLPKRRRDREGPTYSGRAKRFWERMEFLKKLCTEDLDSSSQQHVNQAFRVGLEMYRDSPYWHYALDHHPDEVKDQDNWRAGCSKDRIGIIARVLRRCDAFDVGHRITPDLILHLFTRFGYADGLACYLQHTFATQKPLLLMRTPELNRNSLLIPWADFRVPKNQEQHAIWKAVSLANKIVEDELETILRDISKEGDFHPNLDISIKAVREPCSPSHERLDHVSWALFTLAIAEESSDTNASITAAKLIPLLVEYICLIASTIHNKREANLHTRTQTGILLSRLPSLRSNSAALRRVVEKASTAIEKTQPKHYVARIKKALDEWLTNNPGNRNRVLNWGDLNSEASHFIVYGASKPVARWLAAIALRRQGERFTVLPLYCVRRFLLDDSIRPGFQALAPRAEHTYMMRELGEAMSLLKVNSADIQIAEEPIDIRYLPRLALSEQTVPKMELLIGARAFLEDVSGIFSVSIYGSDALTILCKAMGVPVRIVTWEDVLQSPITTFVRKDQPESFGFSYSAIPRPGTEDERVAISDVSLVTTERRSYTPQEAIQLITSMK